ncbi:Variant-specific surface protein, partial [Giardia duodenalis]
VCRDARDGACVGHAKEVTGRTKKSVRVREAQPGCTADSTNTDHCASGKCDVTIGGKTYCSQCEANYVPIDGTCTDISGDTSKCTINSKGACTQCGAGYFLHKGGCYQFGGEVGKLICTDPSTSDGSPAAGACIACAAGYFKNPTQAAAAVPPCIACNDTTGDATNNKKGLERCATCEVSTSGDTATCRTCLDGYYNSGSESSVTCAECNAACATCSGNGANKCTSCKEADKYLKTDSSAGTSQCVNEAACKQGGTHFPTTTTDGKKICAPCNDAANGGIADCKTCSKSGTAVTCSACTPDNAKKPNKAGTKCFNCQMAGCSHCSADGVCEACDSNKVSPGGSSCMPNCPENSTASEGACICNSGFAPSGDGCAANSSGNLSTGAIAGISVTTSLSTLCC